MPLDQVKAKAESYVKGLFEFSNIAIKSKVKEKNLDNKHKYKVKIEIIFILNSFRN